MYEKIVVGERHGEMVKNHTDIYVDMFKVAFPRNSSCKRNQERITTRPEERYEKFVELLNQGLTMKEIAVALGLSVPATYLIRAQNKDRLLADSNVNKKAPAMRFNCKRI
jgi:FixJ family two-component response regulator